MKMERFGVLSCARVYRPLPGNSSFVSFMFNGKEIWRDFVYGRSVMVMGGEL